MSRSNRRHNPLSSKPASKPASNPFYTLEESFAFENDPSVRIVYMTEKGIDLFAVFPEEAKMDFALRHGYSWYNIMTNPPEFMQQNTEVAKRVCIVKTTEAAIAAHKVAKLAATHAYHIQEIVKMVRATAAAERTQDMIADCVAHYLYSNNLQDTEFWDTICNTLGTEGLLPDITEVVTPCPLRVSAVNQEPEEFLLDDETIVAEDELNQSVGSIGSAIEWVSNIFSIPDMSWVPMD